MAFAFRGSQLHQQVQPEEWTDGPQPLPNPLSNQFHSLLGVAGTVSSIWGAGKLLNKYAFHGRGWDYALQGIRTAEEYSPGGILRTFQLSHIFSPLETASKATKIFSDQHIRNLAQSPEGRTWLENLSNTIGEDITTGRVGKHGFAFSGGRLLLLDEKKTTLLKHAYTLRSPTLAGATYQEGLARSIAKGDIAGLSKSLKAKITYGTLSGEDASDIISFGGGKSRFQSYTRGIKGWGTSAIERLNRLAQQPAELPGMSNLFNQIKKIPGFKKGFGVESSSGLRTLAKLTGKAGIGVAAYLGYKQLDYSVRNSDVLSNTIFDEGITAAGATVWTKGQKAISRTAEVLGLHDYRERQEEIAPGSTSLTKLAAFPIMGALGGLGINYGLRVKKQIGLQAAGFSLEEAVAIPRAIDASFKAFAHGKAMGNEILSTLSDRGINLVQQETEKKLASWEGKIATAIASRQRSRSIVGSLSRVVGEVTPGKLRWMGGLAVGLALVAPFVPGALVPSDRPEKLEALYSGQEKVEIRKGRWWEAGRSAWEGDKIDRFQQHWYPRMLARAKDKSVYGEEELSPLTKWYKKNFTYDVEREHYWDRPYPLSGGFGEDIPFVGPLISSTIGRLIKPPVLMHENEFMKSGEGGAFKPMPPKFGEITTPGESGQGAPISPFGIKSVVGEEIYRAQEAVGMPGFVLNSLYSRITGNQDVFAQESMLESAGRITSAERDYWDKEMGGMASTSELFRRLYPHHRREIPQYNPLQNTMPSWMPTSGERSPDFRTGDPYAKVQLGEERLPGPGYCLHPETKVYTIEGYKKASDIRLEDKVLTSKGFKSVLNIFTRQFAGEIFSIESYGGLREATLLTPEHQVKTVKISQCKYHKGDTANKSRRPCKFSSMCKQTKCRDYQKNKIEWIMAKNLEKGDYVTLPLLNQDLVPFPIDIASVIEGTGISSEGENLYQTWNLLKGKLRRNKQIFCSLPDDKETWYMFGLYLAEGSISTRNSRIDFALSEEEKFISDKIGKVINGKFSKKSGEEHSYTHVTYNIVLGLYLKNIFGTSENKKLPSTLSKQQFLWLLDGLFQGDSHLAKETYTLCVSTKYPKLLSQLFYYLNIFDIDYSTILRPSRKSVYKKTGKTIRGKPCWEITILASSSHLLHLDGNKSVDLSTSKTISNFIIDSHRAFKIRNIDNSRYEGIVYDFEIEDTHEFVTSFLVHNSALHPEMKGIAPENYPLITRLSILADIAPYSSEYGQTLGQVKKLVSEGDISPEDVNQYHQTMKEIAARKTKKEFSPYLYKDEDKTPMERILATSNESQKETRDPSWFERTVGSYWENLAHKSETPLEFLTPVSPASKFVHMRTALEDYKKNQLYGTQSGFWEHPIRDFLKPFTTSTTHALGSHSIPSEVQEKRDTEEYFDILKYVKATRLEREAQVAGDEETAKEMGSKRRETMFGVNPFTFNYTYIMRGLPRRERDYFDAFSQASIEERPEIYSSLPENEKALMNARWKMKDAADIQKAEKAGLLSDEQKQKATVTLEDLAVQKQEQGMPKDKELWAEFNSTRAQEESYPDWYRRTKLLAKKLEGRSLPGPDWVGWCLPGEQELLIPGFQKEKTSNLKIGNQLYDKYGDIRTISAIFKRMNYKNLFEIKVTHDDLHTMKATPNHLVLAFETKRCQYDVRPSSVCLSKEDRWKCSHCENKHFEKYIPEWTPIEKLTLNHYLVRPHLKCSLETPIVDISKEIPKQVSDRLKIDETTLRPLSGLIRPVKKIVSLDESLMWLVGLVVADGNVWSTGKRMRGFMITMSIEEIPILELAQKIVKEKFGIESQIIKRYRKTGNSSCLKVNSGILGSLFETWIGRGCDTKHPPLWIEELTRKSQVAFLEGILTGDGSKDGRDRLVITNESFCFLAKCIWETQGIPVSLLSPITRYNRKPIFSVGPLTNTTSAIITSSFVAYRIETIKEIASNEEVYDFEIPVGHSYQTFIGVYHNSPNVDLEDIKMKVITDEGKNAFEYDLWPDRLRNLARKPMAQEAAQQLQDISPLPQEALRGRINDVLLGAGIQRASINIVPTGAGQTTTKLEFKEDRSKTDREQLRRSLANAKR